MRRLGAVSLLVATIVACGPPQLSQIGDREFVDITEFDTNCGWGDSITSSLHLPDYFDSESRVLETVQPVLDDGDTGWDLSRAVDAGGIWLFVSKDGVVFGAADKTSGTITYCGRD